MGIQTNKKGLLVVLSGPSGAGKGTVCSALKEEVPELVYSVSATTRPPRKGEVEGVNYFFKSKEAFQRMINQGELLEWAKYVNNYYGTPRTFVEERLAQGHDVLLEIEVQGAYQVKKVFPEGVFIFLLPPSMEELRARIQGRGTESKDTVEDRMKAAREELGHARYYDYLVVNDKVAKSCQQIHCILEAEHLRRERIFQENPNWLEGI
ncbi:guanylate kinase [Melghirimyces algeriensis]|uniref:Guanylate kinase n=1 Tax=Melghirimyces algeriensis TaxID=910412 RepID=A0A521BIQ3_9BACL|nr:guanylate kinase [Melghirimyces algeriensis]SMO47037.1 guanylate kinase [Melghirimyces algeriensis]